jgi:hypothetical protein
MDGLDVVDDLDVFGVLVSEVGCVNNTLLRLFMAYDVQVDHRWSNLLGLVQNFLHLLQTLVRLEIEVNMVLLEWLLAEIAVVHVSKYLCELDELLRLVLNQIFFTSLL